MEIMRTGCSLSDVQWLQPFRHSVVSEGVPAVVNAPIAKLKDIAQIFRTAALIDGKPREEAIEALLDDPERVANYARMPWLRDFDRQLVTQINPVGVPRAIREVIEDWPLRDRRDMAKVTAPTLLICREGDDIHPAVVGRILAEVMPNAELLMFDDGEQMYEAIPQIVGRVAQFVLS